VRFAFGEVSWAAAALVVVPAAVASRAVRRGLRTLFHPYAGGSEDVGAVLRVAAAEAASVSVSGGLIAGREGPWVTVYDPDRLQTPAPCPVPVPGSVLFGRWRVSAEHVEAAPRRAGGRWRLALAAPEALAVRAAVAGDTIPLEDGSKSVAEALREAGVPARLRRIWPVIEQAGRMVWVVGARVAPGVAAEPGSPATVLRVGEDA
jgi:tRNA(Ile)-lysidine synthetase-like protein